MVVHFGGQGGTKIVRRPNTCRPAASGTGFADTAPGEWTSG